MSNQIVISSGAKVRSLEGVLTGTAGIVNSVPLGGANGVATLDSLGKVPLSQLPASVVTYLGTWNAATNTPTLTNGVGDVGDLYICNVAGTVNFGAGPITFAVGDWVIYSGTEWQKSAGASGTVTSVAVSESGDALTITGSPITTSGTINIGFAGTGSQYIKGDGTLATFPTTIDQAKRLITEVYNSTGATLSKGTVVYINGGQGNLPTVTKAQANADNTSAQTYGVVQSDITNMNNGFVVVFGSLTDLDTQAYAVGTQLYLSGTTAGAWTSTKPSAPIHLVYVGIVVRSHPTQGVVEIRIQNGYELEELHDVAISSPVNNQGIFYNSSNDLWENKSIATALGYTPANDALVVHLAGTETITGVKNFDIGLTLRDGYYPTPANGYIGLASNGSGLTILTKQSATVYNHNLQFQASSNDYNFPAITGVMAMLEGTQTFSGAKTFTDNTIFSASPLFDQSANYKVGASLVGTGNYIAMAFDKSGTGSGSILSMKLADGTTAKAINLDFLGSPATYTYTFPDLSGTLALLEGTQTFSGNKTFSALTAFTFLNGTRMDYGLYLSKGSVPSAFSGSTVNLYSDSGNNNLVVRDNSNTSLLQFQAASSYTYTFPAASGTLALASDLSSYVPYTGATANVNLGLYAITSDAARVIGDNSTYGGVFSIKQSNVIGGLLGTGYTELIAKSNRLGISVGTGAISYLSLSLLTAERTFTFPDASGTLALTSNLSSYVPYTGATTNVDLGNYDLTVYNIKVGRGSGGISTNTLLSYGGLQANTTGYHNVAIGTNALLLNTTGYGNTAIGSTSSQSITSGFTNTAIGYQTLGNASTASGNTVVGYNAGLNITTGSNNTIIGAYAATATMSNNVILADGQGNIRYQWDGTDNILTGRLKASSNILVEGGSILLKQGVATTSGSGYLSLSGSTGTGTGVIVIGLGNGATSSLAFPNGSNYSYTYPASTGTLVLGTGTTNYLSKWTASGVLGNSLLFDNGTNVGIGTSTPTQKLTIGGTTDAYMNFAPTSFRNFIIGSDTLGFIVYDNNASAYRMVLNSSGNLGIGTSSPATLFHLNSPASTNCTIYFGVNGTMNGYLGQSASAGSLSSGAAVGDVVLRSQTNLLFTSGGDTERMRIFSNGNVAIGRDSDAGYKLQIKAAASTDTEALLVCQNGANSVSHYFFSGVNSAMNTSDANIWVRRNGSTSRSINAAGTINASGADYAEYMLKAIYDNIEKGDIVGVNINGQLTNIFLDSISFVVKSTDPSYVGGDTWFNVEPPKQNDFETKEEYEIAYEEFKVQREEARAKVDRIAFSGQVPCNVLGANVGDYIIPINDNGKITGQAVANPTFEQYQISVGKVWKIMEDGRAWIAVKIG